MKKALFITTVSGFLYQFEMSNVRILQDMGYEVHYAANSATPGYEIDEKIKKESGVIFHNIDIAKSPKEIGTNRKAKNDLVRLVKRLGINLIHCHTPVGGMLGRVVGDACRQEGVKVIYTTHGFHFYKGAPGFYKVFQMAEKKLAASTDVIITINKEDYRNAKEFKLRPGGKVYRIPGEGIDTSKFTDEKRKVRRDRKREELGIADNDFFLLSVGELCVNKNHERVIDAVASIRDKTLKYGICGNGVRRDIIKEKILKEGLKNRVFLYGYCEDVEDYLYAADAFVFPSIREGLGMAALEALASGLPVIAADNRGTREYMKNTVNGYVCRHNDIPGFAKNIEKVRSLSDADRKAMETFAKETAQRFDIQKVRPIMKKIYEETDKRI